MPPRSNAEKQAIFDEKCATLGDWMASEIPNLINTQAVPEGWLGKLQSTGEGYGLIFPHEFIRALTKLGWDAKVNDTNILSVTRIQKSNANYQNRGRARVEPKNYGVDRKKGSE